MKAIHHMDLTIQLQNNLYKNNKEKSNEKNKRNYTQYINKRKFKKLNESPNIIETNESVNTDNQSANVDENIHVNQISRNLNKNLISQTQEKPFREMRSLRTSIATEQKSKLMNKQQYEIKDYSTMRNNQLTQKPYCSLAKLPGIPIPNNSRKSLEISIKDTHNTNGISSHLEIDIQPSSTKAVKTEKLSIQTIENRLETEINSTQEIKFGGYKDVSPPSIKKNNVKRFRATKHLKQILNYNQVIRYKTDYKPVVKKIIAESTDRDFNNPSESLNKPPLYSLIQTQIKSCKKGELQAINESKYKGSYANIPKETINLCEAESIVLSRLNMRLLERREDKENASDNRRIEASHEKTKRMKIKSQAMLKAASYMKRLDSNTIQKIVKYQNDVDVYNNYLKGN